MLIPYCLNIHPGETLRDVRDAITRHALRVKARLATDQPYPLGLRLSAAAVEEFSHTDTLELFKELLAGNDLYVTGINGFPYGAFHGQAVKSAVYQPDWSTKARVNYTMRLCSILAALLPEGARGNVSTAPLGYKLETHPDDGPLYLANISHIAGFLEQLHQETGKKISLAIEPEPDCVIENCGEALQWFQQFYGASSAAREYIGLCLDTCHFAVGFEDPLAVIQQLEAAAIRIERIQLSAAISTTISPASILALEPFIDPVYLHQLKIQRADGTLISLPDLTDTTLSEARLHPGAELRTHFHVPLFFEGGELLRSTHTDLSPEFFAHVVQRGYPLEIESYTFDVLPPEIKPDNIIDSLVMEHAWVMRRMSL
ncbi:MAG: metabolite traffic protein EboE [Kiritimatiellae bacterium]|nr:metabolite traffic protein EboE [Kiritimatiellia bacterium]